MIVLTSEGFIFLLSLLQKVSDVFSFLEFARNLKDVRYMLSSGHDWILNFLPLLIAPKLQTPNYTHFSFLVPEVWPEKTSEHDPFHNNKWLKIRSYIRLDTERIDVTHLVPEPQLPTLKRPTNSISACFWNFRTHRKRFNHFSTSVLPLTTAFSSQVEGAPGLYRQARPLHNKEATAQQRKSTAEHITVFTSGDFGFPRSFFRFRRKFEKCQRSGFQIWKLT